MTTTKPERRRERPARHRWRAIVGVLLLVLSPVFAEASPAGSGPPARIPAEDARAAVHSPFRIALVPLVDRTGGWLDSATAADVMRRLAEELRIPLNDTMHWAVYVPEEESEAALMEALRAQGKKARVTAAMKPLAARLDADLVICPEVTSFYERRFMTFRGETVVETSVRLTLHGYDAGHDRLIKESAGHFAVNDYHPSYEAGPLLMAALDEALDEANLRPLLPPKRSGAPVGEAT